MPARISNGGEELLRAKVCRIGGKTGLDNPEIYCLGGRFSVCRRKNANFFKVCVSKSFPENTGNKFHSTFEAHTEENVTISGSDIPTKVTAAF